MKIKTDGVRLIGLKCGLICLAVLPCVANAQFFNYSDSGDVMVGFRKTGAFQGNFELVVDVGPVTRFLALAIGGSLSISSYLPAQLSDSFPDGYANLQWSVFSAFAGDNNWTNSLGIFPAATTWYTRARTNTASQSLTPVRFRLGSSQALRQAIISVGYGAQTISSALVTTNSDNNTQLVREPISYNYDDLTAFIGDRADTSLGDFGAAAFVYSVENTTPGSFTSPARSDLYQSCPLSTVDPLTGKTTGSAYFVGYFTLNTDGTMSFTRASTNSVPPPPPPPTKLLVGRVGATMTISFGTTNGATYTLHYTSGSGLGARPSAWSVLSSPVTGDGSTKTFTDTSTDTERFYRISAH
jgi:hypothetical protein